MMRYSGGPTSFYVPMHTATRLAAQMIAKVRAWNPTAHVAAYGLYAPMNEVYLRHLVARFNEVERI
jgi:hypothetical protein